MTSRQVFEYALIELNKVKAPSLLLEDYNYLINKAIGQYINKKYNLYDMNQQIDDDLDAIKVINHPITLSLPVSALYYKGTLPVNYLHILNCSVHYTTQSSFKCYKTGDILVKPVARLKSDSVKRVEENYYFKPSYKNPYFYRNNTFLEIRSGNTTVMKPSIAYIDYLRKPTTITLTEAQLESVADISQIIEFPDYVTQEIINGLTDLLMENGSDQRLQTHIPINQSIANPQQMTK